MNLNIKHCQVNNQSHQSHKTFNTNMMNANKLFDKYQSINGAINLVDNILKKYKIIQKSFPDARVYPSSYFSYDTVLSLENVIICSKYVNYKCLNYKYEFGFNPNLYISFYIDFNCEDCVYKIFSLPTEIELCSCKSNDLYDLFVLNFDRKFKEYNFVISDEINKDIILNVIDFINTHSTKQIEFDGSSESIEKIKNLLPFA